MHRSWEWVRGRLRAFLGRPAPFEWAEASQWAPWTWVALGVLLAAPMPLYQWPLIERAVPIMWLLLGGAFCLLLRLCRASWPYALLMAWAITRAGMAAFPVRSLQLLLLMALVGLLWVAAREMDAKIERWVAWAVVAGMAYEFLFGLLNVFKWYPFMAWVLPEHIGKPMGWLTHPNYFGSFLALGLPVIWSVLGLPAAVAAYLLIMRGISGGPIISASVGVVLLVWPDLSRRWRIAVLALSGTAVSVVMTLHEWRLSGRREVWQAIWPEILRYPIKGQGLGDWRVWADNYNVKHNLIGWATLQAHNEPYQLWFELGLIGVAIAGLLFFQVAQGAWRLWWHCPAGNGSFWLPGHIPLGRAWIAVAAVALVNSLGSPTFHLPGQAAIVVLAVARLQAHAAALRPPPERRRTYARKARPTA